MVGREGPTRVARAGREFRTASCPRVSAGPFGVDRNCVADVDDRRAHFMTMIGDACVAARLADIPVELLLTDGSTVRGIPAVDPAADFEDAADETGYTSRLRVDGTDVALGDVAEFLIRRP